MMTRQDFIDVVLKWTTGITIPLLIILMSVVWNLSAAVNDSMSQNEIMRMRITNLENATADIKSSMRQIETSITDIRIEQTKHYSELATALNQLEKAVMKKRGR